jgi:hypothetical protein
MRRSFDRHDACVNPRQEAKPMDPYMHWASTAFDGFVAFLPGLVAGLVILLIGWIIGRVLAGLTRTILHRVGFERFVTRLGVVERLDAGAATRWVGSFVFLIVMITTLMQVARTWGMTPVAIGLAGILAYVPHFIAAVIIFVGALFVANWLRDRLLRSPLVTGEGGPPGQNRLIPGLVRGAIIVIGAFMALRELQFAPEIVNLAFSLTLGAIAVALAIAFGLGGREVASRITQSWYDRRFPDSIRRGEYVSMTVAPSKL